MSGDILLLLLALVILLVFKVLGWIIKGIAFLIPVVGVFLRFLIVVLVVWSIWTIIKKLFGLEFKEKDQGDIEAEKYNSPQRIVERRMTTCYFDEPISEYEFRELAKKAAGRLKRLTLIEINGPIITGSVESLSGLSDWEFCVDFNDYGSVTGAYWMLYSENDDSYIPNRFADLIAGYIQDKRNV